MIQILVWECTRHQPNSLNKEIELERNTTAMLVTSTNLAESGICINNGVFQYNMLLNIMHEIIVYRSHTCCDQIIMREVITTAQKGSLFYYMFNI